jgi:hypothetical protein
MRFATPFRRATAAIALALAAAAPLAATAIVPLRDEALVDGSPLIVKAQVEGKLPATGERPVTDWLVTVERVLKGELADGSIVVRTPGGEAANGDWMHVFGAPSFRRGERVLLFLRPAGPGRFAVVHLGQGAFHLARAEGRDWAVRDPGEVTLARGRRPASAAPRVREAERFAHWIEDRVAGVVRPGDYRAEPPRRTLRALTRAFTLLHSNGIYFRWPEFDSGGTVPWQVHGGQPGYAGGGVPEVQRAMAAWNGEKQTPISFQLTSTAGPSVPYATRDGVNTVLFGDPHGDIDPFDCSEGGTLAIAGVKGSWQTVPFGGRNYYRVVEADVVVNEGIECAIARSTDRRRYLEELITHELGHALGIGHSSENQYESNPRLREAVMYAYLTYSPRGARLFADDQNAARALYKPGSTTPPAPGSCPADTLCLQNGRFRVTASWENQFNGTSGVARVPRRSPALPASFHDLSGFFYFEDPNNVELIVKVLDFGNVVKVFYGQLTNLRFTITVTDTVTAQTRTYRNTAGDCGGFDDAGFPSSAVRVLPRGGIQAHTGAASQGSCRADADTMCLHGNRFAVEMSWRNQFDGSSGVGLPTRLSDLTGAFAFTDRANLETLVKILEFPDRFLVLYGALSNLEYTFTLRDTVTGRTETYQNPAGRYCGGLDNSAF